MEKTLLNLFQDVATVKDLELFKRNTDDFVALLFDLKDDMTAKLSECFPNLQVQAWLDLFKADQVNLKDPAAVQKTVMKVKTVAEKLPKIAIGVAYEIPQTLMRQISDWFINNYGTKVLLDIQVKPEIMGGIVVMDQGSFHDYSLSKRLQEMADRGEFKLSTLLGE